VGFSEEIMTDLSKLAGTLDDALTGHKAVPRLTVTHADLSLDDAYKIQDFGIEKRLERGEKIVGYKVGLTSRAKMEQMGLHTPIYGVLTDKMRVQHEEEIAANRWVHAKIEPEIAFHITKDLRGQVTEQDVFEACSGVAPALEILDSRYEGFKYFSLPDVVADNSSSAAFVVGPTWIPIQGLDLANLKIQILIDGTNAAESMSSEVLGNPVSSIVELCKILSTRDLYLKKGSIVMSGAATLAFELKKGRRFSTRVQSLGEVHVNVKNQ
jgi:2-oxo-3-hexenedioate decarboxylase